MEKYKLSCEGLFLQLNRNYRDQFQKVMKSKRIQYEWDFLGFIEEYEALSKIIPKHFTIVDLGGYAGAQGYYFRNHKKYINVDLWEGERFDFGNTDNYICEIDKWLESENYKELDLTRTFAICNYVPADSSTLRKKFKNLFVYYPSKAN